MDKRRIALVWPYGFDTLLVVPIALGYLKSNLDSEKYDVRIFDCALGEYDSESERLRRELSEFDPHVVGVSSWSPMSNEALCVMRLAKELNPSVTTVFGGIHATSYADQAFDHDFVDFLFRGEADLSFPVFMDELGKEDPDLAQVAGLMYRGADGAIVKNDMERADELDNISMPDYAAMRLKDYIRGGYRWNAPTEKNAPIWVTRGCPYRCQYCAAPMLNGKPVRTHSIEYMMGQIKRMYHEEGIRWFNILDDNFTFHRRYAKDFCRAVIDLNLPGIGFGTPNGIRMQRGDPELWELMYKAGWRTLVVAPESGSVHTLELMKKDLDIDIVPGVVRDIRAAGIKVRAFFILGYPGETPEDLKTTAAFIKKCRFNFVFMPNFNPLPGTPIYDRLVAEGKIEDGLLPEDFTKGARSYTSPELKDFNFPLFMFKVYIGMALRDPLNIPYMISNYNKKMLAKRLWLNFINMFNRKNNELGKKRAGVPQKPQTIIEGNMNVT